VDSAKAGAGAFFRLTQVHRGDIVEVTAADGKTFRYRVTTTRRMLKANLPLDIWSQTGPARLTLVTCGGPFDSSIGRYRDNIVVTAVPA
jgi:LPXTG-site transpeptidase (sortase) family protein